MGLFNYLFQVSACLTVFYLLFYLAFRKLTFFTFNRFYLLISIFVSFIIPAISIKVAVDLPDLALGIPTPLNRGTAHTDDLKIADPVNRTLDWLSLSKYCYFLITTGLLLKLINSIVLILYKTKKNSYKTGSYYYVSDGSASGYSSFFNIIFLPGSYDDQEQIIAHEQMHNRFFHSGDHLFAEIASAFLWFNPFIYFVKKDLYQIHEFEVDRCLTEKYEVKSYAELLLKLATTDKLNLENGFSTIGVKSRVEMLFKHPSRGQAKYLYLLIFPAMIALLYSFTVDNAYGNNKLDEDFVLIIDPAHGGSDAGGISTMGYQEKDITLQMAMQIQALANKKGITTTLTRSKDEFIRLKNRALVKGNVFISLHMKTSSSGETAKGFEVGYCAQNIQSASSYKLVNLTKKQLEGISEIQTSNQLINSNIYVLRENAAPAILIEMGDSNYLPDLNFMLNKQKQIEVANQILQAVQEYRLE
jgi:N-acetylmuramoyl-L-alanine amidase